MKTPFAQNSTDYADMCPHNPDVGEAGRNTSFFEFWPAWSMYFPVILQWLLLSLRYRSLTLPLLANPHLTLSGMVGVPKSELMAQASGACADAILPWIKFNVATGDVKTQSDECIQNAAKHGITLPFVCKPDIGCRGAGVKLVQTKEQFLKIIENYPAGTALLCQRLATWKAEAGIFYVRDPKTDKGQIVSMGYKHLPVVHGDGVSTLGELVVKNLRAAELLHLYQERHKDSWESIIEKDAVIQLVFSASHCRGAVFRDMSSEITPKLTQAIDDMMREIPEFYYGRLDVKFADLEALRRGETIEIIEINGASSESVHIWDKDTSFFEAIRMLLWQYRTLFKIGAHHRKRGMKVPSLKVFIQRLRIELALKKHYPLTD